MKKETIDFAKIYYQNVDTDKKLLTYLGKELLENRYDSEWRITRLCVVLLHLGVSEKELLNMSYAECLTYLHLFGEK